MPTDCQFCEAELWGEEFPVAPFDVCEANRVESFPHYRLLFVFAEDSHCLLTEGPARGASYCRLPCSDSCVFWLRSHGRYNIMYRCERSRAECARFKPVLHSVGGVQVRGDVAGRPDV